MNSFSSRTNLIEREKCRLACLLIFLAFITGGCGVKQEYKAIASELTGNKPATEQPNTKRIVWELGSKLSLAALGYDRGARQEVVERTLDNAKVLADALGVEVPPLPAKSGNSSRDSASILHYLLRDAGDPVRKKLGSKYDAAHVALFDVAIKTNILLLIYVPGHDLALAAVDALKRGGPRAGLPDRLWKPACDKIEAGVPYEEVKASVIRMHTDVSEYLETGK